MVLRRPVHRPAPPAKPSKKVLSLLVDAYEGIEEYRLAIQACEILRSLAPEDEAVAARLSQLSARYTIQKGKYDQEGDFTQSVKDMARQKELIEKDSTVQATSYLRQQVDKAARNTWRVPASRARSAPSWMRC